MKRFLSWIVLALFSRLFNFTQTYIWIFFFWLLELIKVHVPIIYYLEIISIVFIVCGTAYFGTGIVAEFVIDTTQKVHRSEKGTRYIAYGVITTALNVIAFFTLLDEFRDVEYSTYAGVITMLMYGIWLWKRGPEISKDGLNIPEPINKSKQITSEVGSNNVTQFSQSRSVSTESYKEQFIRTVQEEYENTCGHTMPYGIAEEVYNIDQEFSLHGKNFGIIRLNHLGELFLTAYTTEEVIKFLEMYSYICGLMVPLGGLTKAESDQMSKAFAEKMQNVLLNILNT